MTAGTYDIATAHAILAEASAAGRLQAIPAALLFGVMLGALYDIFRMISASLGLREDPGSDGGRLRPWLLRLRCCRCRPFPGRRSQAADRTATASAVRRRTAAAQILQAMLDILYFLVCGILGAVFLYWCNFGILRWYLILCGGIGFFAYSRSIGAVVLPICLLCMAALRAGICTLYNGILYLPLCWIIRLLTALGRQAKRMTNSIYQKIQYKRCRRRVRRILCTEKPAKTKKHRLKKTVKE